MLSIERLEIERRIANYVSLFYLTIRHLLQDADAVVKLYMSFFIFIIKREAVISIERK